MFKYLLAILLTMLRVLSPKIYTLLPIVVFPIAELTVVRFEILLRLNNNVNFVSKNNDVISIQ